MILRLIILLLIVGCGIFEEEDEIKEVKWIKVSDAEVNYKNPFAKYPSLYLMEGLEVDTISHNFVCEAPEGQFCEWEYDSRSLYYFNGDTCGSFISCRNLFHYLKPNYFEITIGSPQIHYSRLYPEEYEIFQYEYK